MRYANDTEILEKNVEVLKNVLDKLVKVQKNYGRKIYTDKIKVWEPQEREKKV